MNKQKKPKTGDVVGWGIADKDFDVLYQVESRSEGRKEVKRNNDSPQTDSMYKPFRLCKIVLAK